MDAIDERAESMVKSADLLNIQRPFLTNEPEQGDLLYSQKRYCRIFRMKINCRNCVQKQDLWKQLLLDSSLMQRMLNKSQNLVAHVGCREHTPSRDEELSTPRGWIRGNTKIGFALEVTTNYHQGKAEIEVKIDFLSGDGSHSWVRISNGLDKFVRDLTENTQIPSTKRTQAERCSFFCNSRMIVLLRHGTLPRDEGGAMGFWMLKEEFKSKFLNSIFCSIRVHLSCWKSLHQCWLLEVEIMARWSHGPELGWARKTWSKEAQARCIQTEVEN